MKITNNNIQLNKYIDEQQKTIENIRVVNHDIQ